MNPEERRMFERLVKVSEDNNRMLHAMRRAALWGRFVSFIYWLIIIGSLVAGYFFLKPYLPGLENALQTINQFNSQIKNFKFPGQ